MALSLLTLCSVAAAATPTPSFLPATNPLLEWTGRRIGGPGGRGWSIDWEGTRVRATVCNATSVAVVISDATPGGAKFGVWVNSSTGAALVPNLRVSTFFTAVGANRTYALASRSNIKQSCVTYTVQLLIEPAFIQDCAPDQALTVEGFSTDGHLVATAAPPVRRSIEFLGDSLTAGYGAGFDLPHSQHSTCGGGGLTDDQATTYGALLCANFSATCTMEAVSGITLCGHGCTGGGLPAMWDWELGGMAKSEWPAAERVAYNASRFQPDAVLINLGENDWGGGKCGTTAGCPARFTSTYVGFVQHIAKVYSAFKTGIVFFLAIGPHEGGQSEAILPAVDQLNALGIKAVFLNATVGDFGTIGCGGHPGVTIHHASFLRAQPIIAATMGW